MKVQIDMVTLPDDLVAGLVWSATINGKTIPYTVPVDKTAAEAAAAIVDLWNDSEIAEFLEITADDNEDGSFTLTGPDDGKPFIVLIQFGDGGNEIQRVTIGGNPTGGTFTLSSGGQTTTGLAPDASAATVQAALEALTTIGADNVLVTADDDGGPYSIEFIGDLAGVNVDPLSANADGLTVPPEIQVLDLGSPTGGTWTVKYNTIGSPTANLAHNISAADLKTALESLAPIGVDDVDVAGPDGGPFTVTFQGAFNGTNAGTLIIDGANLTGGLADSVDIVETTPGGDGGNEVWSIWDTIGADATLTIRGDSNVTAGTWDLTISRDVNDLAVMTDLDWDITVAEFQDALDTAVGLAGHLVDNAIIVNGMGGTTLSADSRLSDGENWTLILPGYAGSGYIDSTFDVSGLTGGAYSESFSNPATNEDGDPKVGEIRFIINGETTDYLSSMTATAADVQEQLEALSVVGAGNVLVTDLGYGLNYRFTFQGELANQSTGFSISVGVKPGSDSYSFQVQKNWTGAAGTAEVQTISISGSPGSGQFGIEFDGEYSAVISYNQIASVLEAILEAMPSIGAGNVSCSGGPFPDTPIVATFAGGLSGSDLDLMTAVQGTMSTTQAGGNPATITVATTQTIVGHVTTQAAEGPNDWNTAANWDTGTVPGNTDTVFILDGDSIWYGLDTSAATFDHVEIHNYDVQIGLPRRNDAYFEYRRRHLKIACSSMVIGLGDAGRGSNRINLEIVGSPTIEIRDSGTGQDGAQAVEIIGENSANTAELLILGGEVGVAPYPKQAAFFNKITQRDGELVLGSDVTIMELIKTGGDVKSYKTTVDGLATL